MVFFSFMASSGGAGDREFKEFSEFKVFSDAPLLRFSKFIIIIVRTIHRFFSPRSVANSNLPNNIKLEMREEILC